MTYVAIDHYLKDGGKLGFVITQSVWKTAGGGQGFRRFRIGQEGPPLRVLHVDDLSALQVFEGASTRTSVVVIEKGQPTHYPVPYTLWQKTTRGKGINYDSTLEEVQAITRQLPFKAAPVKASDITSSWLTARPKALGAIRKVLGASGYQARAGVTTWANGIYWVDKVATRPDGLVVVRNLTEGAKLEVESVTAPLEGDLLYPLLRGREVRRWEATPTYQILLTHEEGQRLSAIPETNLQVQYPQTWIYLKRFDPVLRARSGFKRFFMRKEKRGQLVETGPFYSLFNVGDYTFAPWKVVWREQFAWFTAAVVGLKDGKPVIPDHKLMLVPCETEDEAYYLGGVLNSAPVTLAVWSYTIAIQQTTHILENINVPRYDPMNTTHQRLVALSKRAHELAPAAYGSEEAITTELLAVDDMIDQSAKELWALKDEELDDIRASLRELKRDAITGEMNPTVTEED